MPSIKSYGILIIYLPKYSNNEPSISTAYDISQEKTLLGRHRHFNSLIQNEYEIKKIIDFSIYSTKVDQMYSEVVLSVSSKKIYT